MPNTTYHAKDMATEERKSFLRQRTKKSMTRYDNLREDSMNHIYELLTFCTNESCEIHVGEQL